MKDKGASDGRIERGGDVLTFRLHVKVMPQQASTGRPVKGTFTALQQTEPLCLLQKESHEHFIYYEHLYTKSQNDDLHDVGG